MRSTTLGLAALAGVALANPHHLLPRAESCPSDKAIPVKAPHENIWAGLTKKEATSVYDFLVTHPSYNLTIAENATLTEDYVNDVTGWAPSKDDALAYLSGATSKPPARYALARVVFGSDNPRVEVWKVGPLPISKNTTITNLKDYFSRDSVPWHAKPPLPSDSAAQSTVRTTVLSTLDDAMKDLFGYTYSSGFIGTAGSGCLTPFGPDYDGVKRQCWSYYSYQTEDTSFWLLPLPFFTLFDFSGQDPSKWGLITIVYDGKVYNSTTEFHDAWKTGTLKHYELPSANNTEWALRTVKGKPRKFDDRPGPVTLNLGGARYEVDKKNDYFSWMDWSGYLSFNWETGLALHNVFWKGKRLIYEMGIQDALADYAGADPAQQSTAYLDRFYGIGSSGISLVRGYDCPKDATYLNVTYPYGGTFLETPDAICIFEHDTNVPLSRHTMSQVNSVTRNILLTIRTIATVGNYDYLFDYELYLDGTFEVHVRASGYIQSAYWLGDQLHDYSTKLHTFLGGALHDHVLNFKVDFDIAGSTKNSVMKQSVYAVNESFPWWPEPILQKKLSREYLKTEDEGSVVFGNNGQDVYHVVAKDTKNSWGEAWGYEILPGTSAYHAVVTSDKKMAHNAAWNKVNIAFTKTKDTERSSASVMNQNLPAAPHTDFDTFFDGDSIDEEDITVWFNLAMHHVPRSEDVPTTLTTSAHSYMRFVPFNYGDDEQSRDILQSYYATLKADGSYKISEHGVKHQGCAVPTPDPLQIFMAADSTKAIVPAYNPDIEV